MDYTTLGRTGLKVSRLCLGTMNFGPHTTESDSHAIMDKALEIGIQFFDTADVYGGKRGAGVTEQIIGRWFARGGGRRERVVLATKVFGPMGKDPNMGRGLSALKIKRCCENSLRRLRTDCIDLYQMHHIARETPWEEIWQAMEQLAREGKILYVGSSNFAGWHIATANQTAAQRHFLGLVSEQTKYSLACRTVELEVLPACRHYGVGVLPWSPLDGGMLGGALKKTGAVRRVLEGMRAKIKRHLPQLKKYESLCRALGERPADVALAWLLRNPAVTAPIIGPRTLEQLSGSTRALKIKLDAQTQEALDNIWPGPGGEAPEAYAW
jgi:aryl-alcohol dehydrogenase-like predicted oxidoreductase